MRLELTAFWMEARCSTIELLPHQVLGSSFTFLNSPHHSCLFVSGHSPRSVDGILTGGSLRQKPKPPDSVDATQNLHLPHSALSSFISIILLPASQAGLEPAYPRVKRGCYRSHNLSRRDCPVFIPGYIIARTGYRLISHSDVGPCFSVNMTSRC